MNDFLAKQFFNGNACFYEYDFSTRQPTMTAIPCFRQINAGLESTKKHCQADRLDYE